MSVARSCKLRLTCRINCRQCFPFTSTLFSTSYYAQVYILRWWKVPYYYIGAKAYDVLAGSKGLSPSYFLTPSKALEAFPMLKSENLYGAVVYYDGAQNDSRMNTALALTAAANGAAIANHVEVVKLNKKLNPNTNKEELYGAVLKDTLSNETWEVTAKCIINATGPYSDSIRKLDNPTIETIVSPSSGVHLILPDYFSPRNIGLIDPATSDGRVIFVLPWEGNTIAGTTVIESDPL
jgi:glycerol-3-phosphate dehydrogenase